MKSSAMDSHGGERRTLKTLQVSANGTLIGSEKQPGKNKITVSKKPLKIFQDKKSEIVGQQTHEAETQTVLNQRETECQTDVSGATGVDTQVNDTHNDSGAADLDQEAYDLMVKDPIPESYWRELAEERRMSLAEALAENEVLHQSMEELKEENQNLSLLAGQAEHLASVLNDVLGDDEDDKTTQEEKTGEEEDSKAEEDKENSDTDEQPTTGDTAENQDKNTS